MYTIPQYNGLKKQGFWLFQRKVNVLSFEPGSSDLKVIQGPKYTLSMPLFFFFFGGGGGGFLIITMV